MTAVCLLIISKISERKRRESFVIYCGKWPCININVLSYYNEETASWGKGTALTDGKSFIGAFDGEIDADGNISIMANCAEVTGTVEDENPYGESSMILLTVKSCHDLSLDNVYYAERFILCRRKYAFHTGNNK